MLSEWDACLYIIYTIFSAVQKIYSMRKSESDEYADLGAKANCAVKSAM